MTVTYANIKELLLGNSSTNKHVPMEMIHV
jgi:hypothetical protein